MEALLAAGLQLIRGRLLFLLRTRQIHVFLGSHSLVGQCSIVAQSQVVLTRFVNVSCHLLIGPVGIGVVGERGSFLFEAIVIFGVVVLNVGHVERRLSFGVEHGVSNLNLDVCVVHKLGLLLLLLLLWPCLLGLVSCLLSAFHELLVIEFLQHLAALPDLVSLSQPILRFLLLRPHVVLEHSILGKGSLDVELLATLGDCLLYFLAEIIEYFGIRVFVEGVLGEAVEQGGIPGLLDCLGIRESRAGLLDAGDAESLLSLQHLFDALVVPLPLLIVKTTHYLLHPQLHHPWNVVVELVVLRQLRDLAAEFLHPVLSLKELIVVVQHDRLAEEAGGPCLLFVGRGFEAEEGVDVGSGKFPGIFDVFDLDGVVHHKEDAVPCILLAKDAVVILNLVFRLPHIVIIIIKHTQTHRHTSPVFHLNPYRIIVKERGAASVEEVIRWGVPVD